jgi:hypothetical protein
MPVYSKGGFNVDLALASPVMAGTGGEPDGPDRQCAWELYCELASRVAVVGKLSLQGEQVFAGELLAESLDSLHRFGIEARALMRRCPVGPVAPAGAGHPLGTYIAGLLELAVVPFLEKWESSYRHWWHHRGELALPPFLRQTGYPHLAAMQSDWIALRRFCRAAAGELARAYGLPSVLDLCPPGLRQVWMDETQALCASDRTPAS